MCRRVTNSLPTLRRGTSESRQAAYAGYLYNVCRVLRTWKQGNVETCQRVPCWRLCEGSQLLQCGTTNGETSVWPQKLIVSPSKALERGTMSRFMRGNSDPR